MISDQRHSYDRNDRRRHRPGAACPSCGEFVEERWGTVEDGRLTYICWNGHRWVDRRRPTSFPS